MQLGDVGQYTNWPVIVFCTFESFLWTGVISVLFNSDGYEEVLIQQLRFEKMKSQNIILFGISVFSVALLMFRLFSSLRIFSTAWKVSKYGVFSDPYFPAFGLNTESIQYLSVFSRNAGTYRPEKTPYLDTFHAVFLLNIFKWKMRFRIKKILNTFLNFLKFSILGWSRYLTIGFRGRSFIFSQIGSSKLYCWMSRFWIIFLKKCLKLLQFLFQF